MESTKGQVTFNNVVTCIILGVVLWVGTTIHSHDAKLSDISADIAVLKAGMVSQKEEVAAIKSEQSSQSSIIAQISFEIGRSHRIPPPPITAPKQNP
jgi:hypothetical protein